MLGVGRERAAKRGLDERVDFEQGNAEDAAVSRPQLRRVTIAFGIRNVPRIERALAEALPRAASTAAASSAWNFPRVDVPGLDALYEPIPST